MIVALVIKLYILTYIFTTILSFLTCIFCNCIVETHIPHNVVAFANWLSTTYRLNKIWICRYIVCFPFFLGCNWYGFGAIFFGCLSMMMHGTVSFSRYQSTVHPYDCKYEHYRCIYDCICKTVSSYN